MILTVPKDKALYPTLGPQVCDFIEENLIFGPGDLRGQRAALDTEKRGLIYRMYELFPKGHAQAGRRRFKRVGLSLPKGLGKTELAAWIAACELHPDAPVRCTGFTKKGEPIGGPVKDPYIPMVAYTEEQSDELAYGALRIMLEEGPLRHDFDIGLERILRKNGDGKAVSLSAAPNARDGARTTFGLSDETHWWVAPRLKQAHQTMLNNTAKRKLADPWVLEVTTAPEPGSGSVAEGTMDYAKAVDDGRQSDSSLFFFHRQAGDEHDLTTKEGARAAVIEASGAAASWRDIDAIVERWSDPQTDRAFWERVWCNRLVQSSSQAFDVQKWKTLVVAQSPVNADSVITLGFDGSLFHDATALVGTDVQTGYQWIVGLWECPPDRNGPGQPAWQVPADEADALVRECFGRYQVWRMYADPFYWETWVALWIGLFGKEKVAEWRTNRRGPMTAALRGFKTALNEGATVHAEDARFTRHMANARREDLDGLRDEQGQALWVIKKERPDSPLKMDAAMAAVLSWEARTDAIAAGVLAGSVYETRGALSF